MSDRPKKWGIGVDLAEEGSSLRGLGPMAFAGLISDERDIQLGIHVLPEYAALAPIVSRDEVKRLRERIQNDALEVMARAGLAAKKTRVEIVEDREIANGLSEVATRTGVDALIVGRRAKRDEDPIVRLGEVARRILRQLPVPVVVVPPDFGDADDRGLGKGPILVGVDLSDSCRPAVHFAVDLARRLERPLLLAHGTEAFHWGVSYMPPATLDQLHDRAREEAQRKLVEWVSREGIERVRHQVFFGDPAKRLLSLAEDEDAAVLVTGSRKLGPVERVFLASVSTELAAAAPCPVAVVPGK